MPALVESHKQPRPTMEVVDTMSKYRCCQCATMPGLSARWFCKPYDKGYCAIDIRHGGCIKANVVVGNKEGDHRKGKTQI